jgi:hypothetical protein
MRGQICQIVRVQTADGQFRVECEETATLSDFKTQVQEQSAVRTWDQQFSRDGTARQLIPDDGRSLRSLNITCAPSAPTKF